MPMYRPVSPPMGEHMFEVGLGTHAMFNKTEMGVGASTWGDIQVHENVDLVGRAGAVDIFSYDGSTPAFHDVLWSASGGVRGHTLLLDTLTVGGEALIDYQQRTGSADAQYLSGIFGVPLAEQAVPGLHVYTEILMGLAVPLQKNAPQPFFGFQEFPIGLVWEATPWMLVVAEGGFAIPIDGGYAGVAAAFRF